MHPTYTFDAFELDPARRSLMRTSGEPVPLGGKAFDALLCLIEHAGHVVTRDTLSQALWPTTVVEDNNLTQTIQGLRRALGDTGPRHRYIVTVPRRGYQFVANVSVRLATNAVTRREAALAGRAQAPRRAHPVLLIAGAISIALNVLLFALIAFWGIHRSDPPLRAAAVAAPAAAPVKSAWPIVERDKRELSTL